MWRRAQQQEIIEAKTLLMKKLSPRKASPFLRLRSGRAIVKINRLDLSPCSAIKEDHPTTPALGENSPTSIPPPASQTGEESH